MIKTTTNYSSFSLMEQNRDINLNNRKAKNLAALMVEHGWLDAFPLMAKKEGGKLVVIDGQHRLAIAREYGIPVKYVVEDKDIDVARLNDTSHSWANEDFVAKYAKAGVEDYRDLVAFHNKYGISIPMAAAILYNTSSPGNCLHKLKEGVWRIKNRAQAEAFGKCFKELSDIDKTLAKVNAVKVLWACFQVDYFDPDRLMAGAKRRSGEIKPVTKAELFYEMFEDFYNIGRKERKPLKFDAEQALKARNFARR